MSRSWRLGKHGAPSTATRQRSTKLRAGDPSAATRLRLSGVDSPDNGAGRARGAPPTARSGSGSVPVGGNGDPDPGPSPSETVMPSSVPDNRHGADPQTRARPNTARAPSPRRSTSWAGTAPGGPGPSPAFMDGHASPEACAGSVPVGRQAVAALDGGPAGRHRRAPSPPRRPSSDGCDRRATAWLRPHRPARQRISSVPGDHHGADRRGAGRHHRLPTVSLRPHRRLRYSRAPTARLGRPPTAAIGTARRDRHGDSQTTGSAGRPAKADSVPVPLGRVPTVALHRPYPAPSLSAGTAMAGADGAPGPPVQALTWVPECGA